jgi:hypothetical protein
MMMSIKHTTISKQIQRISIFLKTFKVYYCNKNEIKIFKR